MHEPGRSAFKQGLRVIPEAAFEGCDKLTGVLLHEGLHFIGDYAFGNCRSLQSVKLPSSVTKLDGWAFYGSGLIEVHLKEGLQVIGNYAFADCTVLRSVTIPSTVTELGMFSFSDCSNLSEVVLQGGKRLLNQDFFDRGCQREEQGLLNQEVVDKTLFYGYGEERKFVFHGCPFTTAGKISISWAVSERMARLTRECKVSVERRIRNLRRLQLLQDGNVLACIPIVRMTPGVDAEDESEDEAEDVTFEVRDTNLEITRSLYQVLRLIAFHELKESSILLELAKWKSRIDGATSAPRAECRVPIPDPAKSLIMEYGGFAGFLEPVIEGA